MRPIARAQRLPLTRCPRAAPTAVATRLDEPLTARVDVRELFTLAAVLDAAAEHAERVKGAAPFTGGPRLARLEQLCRVLAPQQKAPDTLAALGLFDFYPHLAAALCGHVWGPGVAAAGVAYLNYVSLLNQVRTVACWAACRALLIELQWLSLEGHGLTAAGGSSSRFCVC